MNFKISLEAARTNAGLTQKEVGKALGKSNKTICAWEKGKSFPDARDIDALCKLYGASYDDINFLPNDSLKENLENCSKKADSAYYEG